MEASPASLTRRLSVPTAVDTDPALYTALAGRHKVACSFRRSWAAEAGTHYVPLRVGRLQSKYFHRRRIAVATVAGHLQLTQPATVSIPEVVVVQQLDILERLLAGWTNISR